MKPSDKKHELEIRIKETQARLKDLKAVARKQARRDETRRKIIYGASVLEIVGQWREGDGKSEKKRADEACRADRMMAALHKQVRRERDREFLGLPVTVARSGRTE